MRNGLICSAQVVGKVESPASIFANAEALCTGLPLRPWAWSARQVLNDFRRAWFRMTLEAPPSSTPARPFCRIRKGRPRKPPSIVMTGYNPIYSSIRVENSAGGRSSLPLLTFWTAIQFCRSVSTAIFMTSFALAASTVPR